MDVLDAIFNRRSVRSYKSDPIPEDVMQKLLEVLRAAPSAANKQPWKFIVVTNKDLRNKLVTDCRGQKFLAQAPVVIVGCGIPGIAWKGMGGDSGRDAIDVDLAIAIDHLTLAAVSFGLGTCWIGAFQEDLVKKTLNIPHKYRVVALTPLGYPESPDMNHPLDESKRKPLNEIIVKEQF